MYGAHKFDSSRRSSLLSTQQKRKTSQATYILKVKNKLKNKRKLLHV